MKSLKKVIAVCIMLAVLATLVLPANADAAAKVKINKTKTTINAGESLALKITGTTAKITWSSSKKSVATVSNRGKVTGIKKGSATITAKVGSKKFTCKINVIYDYDKMVAAMNSWIIRDIWNDGFCDISSYVSDGTNKVGGKMNLERTLEKTDKAMKKAAMYDDFVKSLDPGGDKELIDLWADIREEIDYLYNQIKEEEPRSSDPSYEFDCQDFTDYMYDFMDLIE